MEPTVHSNGEITIDGKFAPIRIILNAPDAKSGSRHLVRTNPDKSKSRFLADHVVLADVTHEFHKPEIADIVAKYL